jgi:hypothetical protein
MTQRLDAGIRLRRLPVATTEAAEVDASPARVREEDRVLGGRQPVERLKGNGLQRAARVLKRVLVCFSRPFA